MLRVAGPAYAFPGQPGDMVIPWLDQPAENPVPEILGQPLVWEQLTSWLTPADQFFTVKHYNLPPLTERDWRLQVVGLVRRPQVFTLAELRARPRREVTFTLLVSRLEVGGRSAMVRPRTGAAGGQGRPRREASPVQSLSRG